MQLRQLIKNALMAVLQVVVAGGVYYVLYKFLLGTIGIALLGVWSIVLATTSIGRLSQLGFGPSIVRFVAKNVARADYDGVVTVIHSGLIFIASVTGIAILLFFPFARWALGFVVDPDVLEPALELLPWALGSLWLTMIAGVYQAGLDGYQRMDLRTTLVMASTIAYLLLCLVLVPAHGLMGLAWAQLLQSVLLLFATAGLLKLLQPTLPLLPTRFRKDTFRELMTYGLNVQAMTALNMLLDPLTKGLLAKFGGVSLVGWYEMANR
ncbi:MAG: oligosaccharide flippase family protein, partial [Myxococcales bacterium]|nr:oligosaccharide flippase family protein [Myxococcales bacterium]